ncbi:hypothetical protein ABPG75_007513 [Micractinium tetrahymenae]
MQKAREGGSCPPASRPPPAPLPLPAPWAGLTEPLLLLIMASLEHDDLAAAHLVARGWRDAARLSVRVLRFRGSPPDTQSIKQTFPNACELVLERMQLSKQDLACIASLPRLTSLSLKTCRLTEGGAIAALEGASGLQELELSEVLGSGSEELDNAIRCLTNLHRLHVESRTAAAPSLRSLAFLPRMRQLSVKQARPVHGFVGLTNLGQLRDLQARSGALELRGASVTNSIMHRLAELTQLIQLRLPEAALVTDGGFAALAGLTALQELDLSCLRAQADAPVGDAGAAHLASLGARMTSLSLAGRAPMTAGGLAFLGSWGRLQQLDLCGVRLDHGSAAFLWRLTGLTSLQLGGTKMAAAQFEGLPCLARLQDLDVSGTGFDDACCAHLAAMPDVSAINLSGSAVTTAGVCALCASHPGRLRRLQLEGCRVAMTAVLHALRRQPPGVTLWCARKRGYLPRWVNLANSLLMVGPPGQRQRLRLRHAPEAGWPAQACMSALVAGMLLGHAGLLMLTTVLLLLLPLAGLLLGAALLVLMACGRRPSQRVIVAAASRAEVCLSAVLVGFWAVEVPPPPPPPTDHHF